MMKTIQLLWLSLLFTGLCITVAMAQVTVPANSTYTRSFSVNPGTLSTLSSTSVAYYKVFINTGDGHYFNGDYGKPGGSTADLSTFKHTYRNTTALSKTYAPYAEFVEVYDDGEKPGRKISSNLTTTTATTASPARVISGRVALDWARKVVAGHENTYAVTVKNTSNSLTDIWYNYKVQFTYDTDIFTREVFEPNSSNIGENGTSQTNIRALYIRIPILKPGEQISIFFPLVTKTTAPPNQPVQGLVAGLYKPNSVSGSEGDILVEQTPPARLTVELAHDPNFKTPSLSVVAVAGGLIEYRIDFQNDGAGYAQNVHVSDELEDYLLNAPQFILASHSVVNPVPTQVAPRVWQWSFRNMNLMGLNDRNYTPDKEPLTKGWLRFQVPIGQVAPCQAIVNSARIVFECNPPIYTDFAFTTIPCNPPPPGVEPIDSCQITTTWLPTISTVPAGAAIADLFPGATLQGYTCKWYPATRLTSPLTAATGVTMARPETYVLVAAKSCERKLYYVTVRPGGRDAESPLLVEDKPGDCVADIEVFGGEPPYSYEWVWRQGPMTRRRSGGTQLGLTGRTRVKVTVTDARGCSVVFSPAIGRCGVVIRD